MMPPNTKRVLDKGYVRRVAVLGSDLTVVNAARASFEKERMEMDEKDKGLISFLVEHGHTSPFRHAIIQFEVRAPILVKNQWLTYRVGSAHAPADFFDDDPWNEGSRRYVTENPEFYFPDTWRQAPKNKKQGSGGDVDPMLDAQMTAALRQMTVIGNDAYTKAIEVGVAPEQARLLLPAYGMYVRWYWTVSLQGVAHFLNQRLAHDAQKEIQDYARVVYDLTKEVFPLSTTALVKVS